MFATVLYCGVAAWTLYEIHTGATDTHALAEAAKTQAEKMGNVSDAADKIRKAADGMVTQEQRIADNAKTALEDSNRQAKSALDATIEASRSDQRAYVTIGKPDGTIADIVWPKDESGKAGLIVYFQNNGRLPARFNWGADSTMIAVLPADPAIVTYDKWKTPANFELTTDHMFQPMYRAKSRKSQQIQWSGNIDIAGGSSYEGVLWEAPKDRMTQYLNFEAPEMPSGKFEYCDGFGQRVCKSFRLRYARDPYDRFFLVMQDECFSSDMQIIHPLPDYDYLPVCGTRERPEKQFTLPNLPKPQ